MDELRNYNRRKFLKRGTVAAATVPLANSTSKVLAEPGTLQQLTILHTNDVHSRIEPFPMGLI